MSETAGIDALLEKRAQHLKNIAEIDAQLKDVGDKITKALGVQVVKSQRMANTELIEALENVRKPRAKRASADGGITVNDAILQSLNKQTGTSVDDIAKSVAKLRGGEVNRKGLGVALSQLKSKGKISNKGLERGFYKLA